MSKILEAAEAAERRAAALRKLAEAADELGENEVLALLAAADAPSQTQIVLPQPATVQEREDAVEGKPRGRDAIRIIVRERPGIWTLAQLRDEMKRRGWFTSEKGVEAAASRLCRLNGEGRNVGKGRYVFPANYGKEGAVESDASGVAMNASYG